MGTDRLAALIEDVGRRLAPADAQAALFPGDDGRRQPLHTVYVPADRYRVHLPRRYGDAALALLDRHAPTPAALADMTGLTALTVPEFDDVHARVRAKLERQPIEDLRLDFEDGYGHRPDDVEDATAVIVGQKLGEATNANDAPLLLGIRIKGLQAATRHRALRTLYLLVEAACAAGPLPPRFVVTLPKVAHPAEVEAFTHVCERLEEQFGLAAGSLRMELQIEVPQAVVGPDGAATVARLVHAAAGRCEGLHYGTYDFSAAAGVAAGEQSLEHPLADHAKAVMQLAAAGTGVRVSDGSTNVVPPLDGDEPHLVRDAWHLHARLVLRSLRGAVYQGWDLHPGHLVTRYAATYSFLRAELIGVSGGRLRAYATPAAAGVLEEPATGEALARGVLRGLDCGAYDDGDVLAATGLDRAALGRLVRREA